MFTNVNHEDLWWLSLKKKDLLELAFTLSQKALPLWNGFNFPGNFKDKIKSLPQFALAEIAVSMVKKSDNESHLNDYYTSFITPVVQIQDGDLKFPYEVKLAFLSVFDILKGKKPSVLGFCIGAVVGLVAITPASGYVAIPQSIFIGVVAAVISNIAVYYKSKSPLDDTLDVFPCHGIGGIVGMILTGIFATKTVNAGGNDGLFYGNPAFFFTQLKGLGIVVAYSFASSYAIFKFINWIMPMRVSEEDEELGLDASQHDEKYFQGTLLVKQNGILHIEENTIEL